MRHGFCPCSIPMIVLLCSAKAPAQNTSWFNFENRTRLAIAPEANGNLVAFGGDRGSTTSLLDDTWGLTPGAGWGLLNAGGTQPPPRSGHSLALYPGNPSAIPPRPPHLVMIGGTTAGGVVNADTWVYSGNQWSLVTPFNRPPQRRGHATASDGNRNVVILFGGSGAAANLSDTWQWDGVTWLQRAVGGTAPSPRSGHAMVWNGQTGRVILFGGNPASDETWEFDDAASAWTRRLTSPGNTPPGRVDAALAYDRFNRNVVLFGGKDAGGNALNDTWVWDPAIAPNGGWVQQTPGFSPPGRFGHAMQYDIAAQRVVMTGGGDAAGPRLEGTYEWDGSTWRRRTNRPAGREYAPMVWDSHRRVAVLFGGYYYNDTWELSQAGWQERLTSVAPSPRGAHAIAYDSLRRRTVIFGGAQAGNWVYNSETWEWDGSTWQIRLTTNWPPPLTTATMAFDAARANTVLFGGADNTGRLHGDTWTYDGTNWTLRAPATSPPARGAHGMAFDARRGRVVLFGGHNYNFQSWLNDTWEWDGTNWQQMTPAVSPSPRGGYMTYDEARGRVTIFGGYDGVNQLADTWEWDGTVWTIRFPLASAPTRHFASISHDEHQDVTYLWGGFASVGNLSDTWYHQSLFPARYRTRDGQGPPFGAGCPGSAGIPTLQVGVGERPWLGDTFTVYLRNVPANPIAVLGMGATQLRPALSLGFLGMGSCLLHTNPILTLPMTALGTSTLTVPIDPGLVRAHFYNQAFTFDPPANTLGLTASDLAEATIGVR